jgi:hypothetical protein
MKKVHLMMMGGVLLCLTGMAQTDTMPQEKPTTDTLRVGSIIIIKNGKEDKSEDDVRYKQGNPHRSRWKNKVSTNWFVVDLGFANHNDKTNYGTAEAQSFVHGATLAHPADKSDFNVKT